tara:strand:- start:1132 stop:3474 length:2343 start_codon:yes stop_codon:yes gene_type:complete
MKYEKIISDWQGDFVQRIKLQSGSKKQIFDYSDAVSRSLDYRTEVDEVIIQYLAFINSDPLKDNDYFKYVQAYRQGKKLNKKYFRHSIEKLNKYYKKVDNDDNYNPFNYQQYKEYVLYMMLKLYGVYEIEYDEIFNVKTKDHRVYTPLSRCPSVLRAELPMKVKEIDISRAFPTFISNELGIEKPVEDVYSIFNKTEFNTLINLHSGVNGTTMKQVRDKLRPVYKNRVNDVITEERFNNKGKMFKDLVVQEERAIKKLVKKNKIKNYVRLHDGVFVLDEIEINKLKIKEVEFATKPCNRPSINPVPSLFYKRISDYDVYTSAHQYAAFFEQENFIRGREESNDNVIILKDTNNVVAPFNHKTETVGFLKSEINELHTAAIENKIAKENKTLISQAFLLLPSKAINYYRDTPNTFGLPFKNGFYKLSNIENWEINQLKYSDVNAFFAPHTVQNHNFIESDIASEFEAFLTMVSVGKDPRNSNLNSIETELFERFCMMFGYLCHTYKNPALNPCIILSDDGANDVNRNGGRGKTILAQALQYVQPAMIKGGGEFDSNYIHNFADLTEAKNLYIIDDVPAGFKYDDLYTNIVGSISPQRKGKEAVEIPFNKTPKFVITTNWSVRYDEAEASTNRRFYEYKFTDYFNLENTPYQTFGHTLFSDWDHKEWNSFYNFVYKCVALYLTQGLQKNSYNKIQDNFRAIFNNDSVLEEFERIFNILTVEKDEFTVSDFLTLYKASDNPLKFEDYFHKNNVKNYIDVYIKYNKLDINYVKFGRRWIVNQNI